MELSGSTKDQRLVAELDSAHASVNDAQRRLLTVILECDRGEAWRDHGCRDSAQWLSQRLGISNWAARRYITAAYVLPLLPRLNAAFESGSLSLDKVLELCRYATPETEPRLVSWARRVSTRAIRRAADRAARRSPDDFRAADSERFVRYWWFDDGRRMGLEGTLPADQGAVVAKALDRLAGRLPDIIDSADDVPPTFEESLETRRADALVAMASATISSDTDADRATVVVHADLDSLCGDTGGSDIEGGPIVDPETARRLSCDARVEIALHGPSGATVGVGRASRTPPPWLLRQLRHRDGGCTFPGCESGRFLHCHHIVHWARGGRTDLDNLILVCTWHHRLVHEYGWTVALDSSTGVSWFRPSGDPFGPDPPGDVSSAGDPREAVGDPL